MSRFQLQAVRLSDSVGALARVGFTGVDSVLIGNTRLFGPTGVGGDRANPAGVVAASTGAGIVGAQVVGVDTLDGLAVGATIDADADRAPDQAATQHPNGVVAIDHIVVRTPDPDRTMAAFETAGIEARRVRRFDGPKGPARQVFYWLGDVICEVSSLDHKTGDGPATWWGLALSVADIDQTADLLGDLVSPVRDAVQPGRRVCTLRSEAGVETPILFMSPHR